MARSSRLVGLPVDHAHWGKYVVVSAGLLFLPTAAPVVAGPQAPGDPPDDRQGARRGADPAAAVAFTFVDRRAPGAQAVWGRSCRTPRPARSRASDSAAQQALRVVRRRREPPSAGEREVGDVADARPAQPLVDLLGVAARLGVEHEAVPPAPPPTTPRAARARARVPWPRARRWTSICRPRRGAGCWVAARGRGVQPTTTLVVVAATQVRACGSVIRPSSTSSPASFERHGTEVRWHRRRRSRPSRRRVKDDLRPIDSRRAPLTSSQAPPSFRRRGCGAGGARTRTPGCRSGVVPGDPSRRARTSSSCTSGAVNGARTEVGEGEDHALRVDARGRTSAHRGHHPATVGKREGDGDVEVGGRDGDSLTRPESARSASGTRWFTRTLPTPE